MGPDNDVYVGLDTSKLKISVAIADAVREGEVRLFGDIDRSPPMPLATGSSISPYWMS